MSDQRAFPIWHAPAVFPDHGWRFIWTRPIRRFKTTLRPFGQIHFESGHLSSSVYTPNIQGKGESRPVH